MRSESKVDAEWLKEMIAGIQHEASLAWQNGAELLVFSDTDLSMGGRDDEDLAVWTVQRRAPEVTSLLQSQEEWGNRQGINWSMRGRCFGACPTQELPSMFRNKLIQVNRRDVQPEEEEPSHLLGVAADEETLAAIMGRIRSESTVDAEWLKELIAGIQHEASLPWQNGAELLVFSDTDLSMGGRDDEDLAVWTVQRRAPEVTSLLQSQEEWGNRKGINWSMRGRCFGACPTQELPSMFRNKLIQVNRRDVQPEEEEPSRLLGVAADEETLAAIMGRIRSESTVDAPW